MVNSLSRRVEFNSLLKELLGSDNVYFQPPPDLKMSYPCIVYERDKSSTKHANNLPYSAIAGYQVTHIDYEPDSDVLGKLESLPLCEFDRHFATSGLNHDVYTIYY